MGRHPIGHRAHLAVRKWPDCPAKHHYYRGIAFLLYHASDDHFADQGAE